MVAVSQPTVDKIIFGAEATLINKIGTCWIASMDVLRKAVLKVSISLLLMNLHFILMLIWRETILSFHGPEK